MPHLKKLKNVVIEIVFLLSLIAITGHLIANYRERHEMQNEISHIRNSLHYLKDSINNIGTTYDKLYKEMTSFMIVEDDKSLDGNILKDSYDKGTDYAAFNNKLVFIENINNRTEKDKDIYKQFIVQASNATTITRNPLKATGVGSGLISPLLQRSSIRDCKKNYQLKHSIHKCYKNFKTCSCDYSHWKF